ncbi:MAG TPA: hypothetical protein VHQ65_06395 [Thermoanaerobaculia bacterium]|nr:hypothetical protein [Thermoanaerobaculia bacterium]
MLQTEDRDEVTAYCRDKNARGGVAAHVVGAGAGRQPLQEPQRLLSVGQRETPGARPGLEPRTRGGGTAERLQPLGQLAGDRTLPLVVIGRCPGRNITTSWSATSCSSARRRTSSKTSWGELRGWRVTSCTTTTRSSPSTVTGKAAPRPGCRSSWAASAVASMSCG